EEEQFRLYFMDHCMHTDCEAGNGGDHQHIVSYAGAVHQALLDLSDWTERGISPRESTGYHMEGGQVILKEGAAMRKGLQPIVSLTANGAVAARVQPGEEVTFCAAIALPEGSGDLDLVLWDFEATDRFSPCGTWSGTTWLSDRTGQANAACTHTFTVPGTYFAVVRAAANKEPGNPLTRIWNMARVRIEVN
ncbi:MAG: hypothetical protein ACI4OJ_09390, partial [Lachnospiraceae bacterium]